MTAKRITVRGRVQGVGFRYSAAAKAGALGLAGWIRNEADGSVLAWVQGDAPLVAAFCAWMEQGPPGARVTACVIEELPADSACRGFRVSQGGLP
jgi:acylphosphatase